MKTAALLALVVGLVAVTTVASPLVASGFAALGWSLKFTRVYNRVFEVLLVLAIACGWRRLDLGGPSAWGFRRERWARDLAIGLALGLAGIGAALAVAWAGGGLVPALRFAAMKTVWKALLGMAGAVVIGVGEEALFRGVLLRRFVLDCGLRAGIVLTTAVYAVVHALRDSGKVIEAGAWAGWARSVGLFVPLGEAVVWPGIVGLFGLGLLLAFARRRSGALWVSVGIHASWVAVFRVGRLFFDIRHRPIWLVGPGWPPLVGGGAGLVALAVTALLARAWLPDRGET